MASVTKQIGASNLDAAQSGSTVTVDGGALNANASTQYIGLIFTGLEELEDKTINSAYLEWNFSSGSFDSPYVLIYGIKDSDTQAYWAGTSNEISGIFATDAEVTWDQNNIGTGWKSSPDIKTVVQEIIDATGDGGWTSGRVGIIIQGIDATSEFRITSYDGSSSNAPKLVVDYSPKTQGITPGGIATVEAFGSGVLTQSQNVAPGGIGTVESVPEPVATPGAVAVLPGAMASAEGFGNAAIAPGGVSVTPDGIATAEALGDATVAPGAAFVLPDGIATGEAVGEAAVSVGTATIAPDGIATGEAVGEHIVHAEGGVTAESVATGEAFGEPDVAPGVATVAPDGIVSGENVSGVVIVPGAATIAPDSIETAEALGVPVVTDHRWVATLSAGADDGYEDSGGLMYLYTTSANVNAAQPWVALLFRNLPVPAGATVVHTYLRLWMFTYDDPNLTARMQKSAAPADLSATSGNISGRTPTDNGVVWSASNVGLNRYNDSPDLAAVLQEVIGLPGWTADASDVLVVLHDNGAGGHIRFNMSDNTIDRPQLVVDYVVGETTQTITVPGIASVESLGNPALTTGETTIVVSEAAATGESVPEPGLVTTQEISDAGEIATAFRSVETIVTEGGPVVTVDDGIATEEAIGEAMLTADADIAIDSGIATAESVGEAAVGIGAITIAPDGIVSAEAIGAAGLSMLAFVLPEGIASAEAIGAVTLSPGTVVIVAGSVASAEAMGELLVTTGELIVLAHSITSAEAVAGPVLSPGAVSVEPGSIETAESVGAAAVASVYGIAPDSIATAESISETVVVPGAATVAPDGIGTAESVVGPELSAVAWVLPDGIATGESLGALTVVPGGVVILPEGIETAESIGGGVVAPGPLVLLPDGLASGEAFGAVALEVGAVIVAPASFGGASFGTAWVVTRFVPRVNIYRVAKRERGNND